MAQFSPKIKTCQSIVHSFEQNQLVIISEITPLPRFDLEKFSNLDIIAGQDDDLDDSKVEGGFIFLNATKNTEMTWSRLERNLNTYWLSGNQLNEMYTLNYILKNPILKSDDSLKDLKWDFMPRDKYVSGRWYKGGEFLDTKPVVIQNNWVTGVDHKMERAHKQKQWFLEDNQKSCLDPKNYLKEAILWKDGEIVTKGRR